MIGEVVGAMELRRAAQATLEKWLPSVIHELARRHDMNVRKPRTWTRLPDFRKLTKDASPAIIVTSGGLREEPERDGDGFWSGVWALTVYVVVHGANYQDTSDLVGIYTAAIRTALLQHGIEDLATRVKWVGEGYNEVDANESRIIGAGAVAFSVPLHSVVNDQTGPTVPPPAPDYLDPEDIAVNTAEVTVDQL